MSSNPSNIFKYQSNPKIAGVINKVLSKFGGGMPGMGGEPGGMGGMPGAGDMGDMGGSGGDPKGCADDLD